MAKRKQVTQQKFHTDEVSFTIPMSILREAGITPVATASNTEGRVGYGAPGSTITPDGEIFCAWIALTYPLDERGYFNAERLFIDHPLLQGTTVFGVPKSILRDVIDTPKYTNDNGETITKAEAEALSAASADGYFRRKVDTYLDPRHNCRPGIFWEDSQQWYETSQDAIDRAWKNLTPHHLQELVVDAVGSLTEDMQFFLVSVYDEVTHAMVDKYITKDDILQKYPDLEDSLNTISSVDERLKTLTREYNEMRTELIRALKNRT